MPIRDQSAQERSLDNDYGATRGPNAPDSFEVAFFSDDGDTEIAGGGYVRATLDNDDWLPAADGVKASLPIAFADSTDEWADTVTHAGLYDPVAAQWWDVVPLDEPLDVTGAGDGPIVILSIFYDNNLD